MKSFKEYITEAINTRTLKKWYKEFNSMYFQNSLPDIKIVFKSMPINKFGHVTFYKSTGQIEELVLNKVLKNFEDKHMKDVLIHEMIHVSLIKDGIFHTTGNTGRDDQHGKEFQDLLRKIEPRYGRKIPKAEDGFSWLED